MVIVVAHGRIDHLVGVGFMRLTMAFCWLTGRNALPLARLFWLVEFVWLGFMVELVSSPAVLIAVQSVGLTAALLMMLIDRWNVRASLTLHLGIDDGILDVRSIAVLTRTSFLRGYSLFISCLGYATASASRASYAWAVYWTLKALTLNFSRVIIPRGPSAWKRAKGKFKNVVSRLIPAPSPA